MSLEAWGDHDPNDELCAVTGCGCKARAFEATCSDHRNFVECSGCGEWVGADYALEWPNGFGGTYTRCVECD